ncbi:MAG TPA: flavodoxin, partial [Burkholderiaceae bacterium]
PSGFEVVVMVSPVWCWRLSPPMRSFARSMHGKLGNVAVVSCMGGSGASNAVAEIERLAHRKAVATLALRQDQVEAGRHAEPLQAFADEVAAFAAAHARPKAAIATAKAA